MYEIYDKDKGLSANLNNSPKLSYQALHPGNKQSVLLALAIIRETTIAPARSYFPTRSDLSGFLNLINIWWIISSSRYTPNVLGNVIIFCYKKTDFYRIFADWIEFWCASPSFKLTCQRQGRSQTDPIDERRFSQYRQMSGRRFLVSLRKILNSERILSCRSLIEENINFWEENIDSYAEECLDSNNDLFDERADEIMEAILDDDAGEVAATISGYVAKKLIKRSSCDLCNQALVSQEVDLENNSCLKMLSHGGLFVPSRQLVDFVCGCFAILNFLEKEIVLFGMPVAKVATYTLKRYGSFPHFSCNMHHDWNFKFALKIIVNTFFNNTKM